MEQSPGTPRKSRSGLSFVGTLILFLIPFVKAIDLVKLRSSSIASAYELGRAPGALNESSTCKAVRVQLHRPLAELRVLITAGDSRPSLISSSRACSFETSIHESFSVPEFGPCTFAGDIASGDYAVEEHWLRIESVYPEAFMSIQDIREHPGLARRQLRSVPPGYILVSNTSGSSPGGARAFARNVSAATLPSGPSSAPPPQPPPSQQTVPVACCCGANAQNTPGTAQSCCCGPITACCQQTGFCANSNCTAIFVGSTLVAGTIISILTCGVCVYRARAQIRTSQSRDRARQRSRVRQPMRLLPVRGPPASEEGSRRECPVCLEEITANLEWVVFPCNHATCKDCYHRLVVKLLEDDTVCPMCRAPLAEPVPEASPATTQQPEVAVEMQPQLWSPGAPTAQPGSQRHIAGSDAAPAQPHPVGCAGAASSQSGATRAAAAPALVAVRIRVAEPSQAPPDASGSSGQSVGGQPAADSKQTHCPSAVPCAQAQSVQHGGSPGAAVQQGSAAASSSLDSQRRHDAERCAHKQAAGERWADVAL